MNPASAAAWHVTFPSWRLDLDREIDLIEEVARVYGYNKFADTLPTFTGTVIELSHFVGSVVGFGLLVVAWGLAGLAIAWRRFGWEPRER